MSGLISDGLIGVVIGGLARFALPGRNPGGLLVSVLVGIGGALIATYITGKLGWYQEGDTERLLVSVAGAALLLAIFRFLSGTTAKAPRGENDDF